MRVKSLIGFGYETLVELLFAATCFVAADEEDGVSLRIEGERYTPHAASGVKPQLLHIRVTATLQSVHVWAPELGPEPFQEFGVREHCVLYDRWQYVELGVEILVKLNQPRHV
jgi:hypothetical protein